MKKNWIYYTYLLITLLVTSGAIAQTRGEYRHQFRISVDEDFINIRGKGTDKAYTAGTFIDYFYERNKPGFFLERWAPKAGPNAVNIFGTGLIHMMFTPNNLKSDTPINNDYPYASALLAHFSSFSYNQEKKFSFQAKFLAGVMGPASGARHIQTWVHNLTGTQIPQGWEYQLPNDILLNLELAAEKQIIGFGYAELIGGGRAYLGSMTDGLEAYAILRTGLMKPYFKGLMSHTGTPPKSNKNGRWQIYAFARPAARFIAYNALLQGGIILDKYKVVTPAVKKFTASLDYGLVLSHGNFGISFTQKVFSAYVKGVKSHEVGNISLYFNW
ncbi:MAG: lipid A deacylase LpxR family protein [Pseudobacter sp.]|uniref:lipid A deacylase LpxR family protein n=1 Tax=Pseudobacter sp. TaxID=2045420 RepID=UPI003F81E51F